MRGFASLFMPIAGLAETPQGLRWTCIRHPENRTKNAGPHKQSHRGPAWATDPTGETPVRLHFRTRSDWSTWLRSLHFGRSHGSFANGSAVIFKKQSPAG